MTDELPGPPATKVPVWITRNSTDKVPADVVQVWFAKPVRYTVTDVLGKWQTVTWLTGIEDDNLAECITFDIDHCKKLYNVIPDTDLQCIRVGK